MAEPILFWQKDDPGNILKIRVFFYPWVRPPLGYLDIVQVPNSPRSYRVDYLVLAQFFDLASDLGLKDLLDLEASPPSSYTNLVQSPSQGVCERTSSPSAVKVFKKSCDVASTSSLISLNTTTRLSSGSQNSLHPDKSTELVEHDSPSSSATSAPSSSQSAANPSSSSAAKVCASDGSSPSISAAPQLPPEPEQHMSVVAAVRICPVCLERVKSKSYKRHMMKHDSLLPPPCHFCGKQIGRKDHLVRHVSSFCPRSNIISRAATGSILSTIGR